MRAMVVKQVRRQQQQQHRQFVHFPVTMEHYDRN
jgi:hypothetical protein